MNKNKCFVQITNKDIYEEVKLLREDFNIIKSKNKLNLWMSSTALSLVIGIIIGYILKI